MLAPSRDEALDAARRLLRGFSGAPDPRRHAQQLHQELVRATGWSAAEEAELVALGAWLQTRPDPATLKPRLAALLARLRWAGS